MRPLFILAPSPRSGTTFTRDLLCAHPQIVATALGEDWFLPNLSKLEHFINATRTLSKQNKMPYSLESVLGSALVAYAGALVQHEPNGGAERWIPDDTRYLVLKTPRMFDSDPTPFFPDARFVVVIRDGRDTVWSRMKMLAKIVDYDERFLAAAGLWAEGVRTFLSSDVQSYGLSFENLLEDADQTRKKLCKWLEIEESGIVGVDVPVRGTSTQIPIRWTPTNIPNFNPIGRWRAWSDHEYQMYEKAAGAAHRALFGALDWTKQARYW